MHNYQPITMFDTERIYSHPLYKRNIEFIEKYGMDSFLIDNGILGGLVPFRKHPDEGFDLIGYSINIRYRTTRKNEDEYNTEYYEMHNVSKDEKEVTTIFLLKSFEFIEHWMKLEKNINSKNG